MDINQILSQTVRLRTEQGDLVRGVIYSGDREIIKEQLGQIDPFKVGVQTEQDRISGILRAQYANVGRNASRTAAYRIAKELAIDVEAWTPLMKSIEQEVKNGKR